MTIGKLLAARIRVYCKRNLSVFLGFSGCLLFLQFLILSSSVYAIPQEERDALIALFYATDGPHWHNKYKWMGSPGSESKWYGVTVEDDHVTVIRLPTNHLVGEVPAQIKDLTRLRELNLEGWLNMSGYYNDNRISRIAPEIGQLNALGVLNLPKCGLDSLPSEIGNLKNLRHLDLRFNSGLIELPAAFGNLTSLEELLLSDSSLSQLPGSIGNLQKLLVLDLRSCRLDRLPPEIGLLSSLRELNLARNQLIHLPDQVGGLSSLEELRLSENLLAALPDSFGDLSQLSVLNLSLNQFSSFPAGIGRLGNLTELWLSGNSVKTVPAAIGGAVNLQKLFLSANQIGQIDPAIGALRQLVFLDLSENQLDTVPPALGELSSLRELELQDNRLTHLPSEIGHLIALERIDLSGNQIAELPAGFSDLAHLERLYLSGNQITELPVGFGDLAHLEMALLARNQLSTLPTRLGGLESLRYLDLSSNLFETLPEALGEIPGPLGLDADDNRIRTISADLLARMNLNTLRLSHNALTDTAFLKGTSHLVSLDLSHNHLQGPFPPEILALEGLAFLSLVGNQLLGEVPQEVATLVSTIPPRLDLQWNGLYTHDSELSDLLSRQWRDYEFGSTQTVPPNGLQVVRVDGTTVSLEWSPIRYTGNLGGYEVFASTDPGGPFVSVDRTIDKLTSSLTVADLDPGTAYYFKVRTVTLPHDGNRNQVESEFSEIVSATTGPASEIFFPLLRLGNGQFTGLAVSNTASRTGSLTFEAFEGDGNPLTGQTNPSTFSLPGLSQLARLGSEIFSPLSPASTAWIRMTADSGRLGALFLIGGNGFLDGAAAWTHPADRLYFPGIFATEPTTSVRFQIVNPSDETVEIHFRLVGKPSADGETEQFETNRTLTPRAFLWSTLEEIVPTGRDLQEGYLELEALGGRGVIALQWIEFAGGRSAAALSALTPDSSRTLYSAQLATTEEIETRIQLVNTSSQSRSVVLTAVRSDGTASSSPLAVTLAGHGRLETTAGDLVSGEGPFVGSLRVESDGPGLVGSVLFACRDALDYATALPLQSRLFTEAVFSQVANTKEMFTGLAFFNPSSETARITISVFSAAGVSTGVRTIELAPGARISRLLSELLPTTEGQVRGSITIRSTAPIAGQQIFGDYDQTYLSAVPPTTRALPLLGPEGQ